MANVIRQDVIQVEFESDFSELTRLKNELEQFKRMLSGGLSDDAFSDLTREARRASESIDNIGSSVDDINTNDVERLRRELNNTDSEAEDAHSALRRISEVSFNKLTSGLKTVGSALGTVALKGAKITAAGVGAAAVGAGALVGQSVAAYADYEQLVGGVDTLFKDSSKAVQKYANDAYKTAGLSANEYMETVTSFSA